MFCPKCGQQFVNEARFCSRCGMHLNAVAGLVASNGLLAGPGVGSVLNRLSSQKKGMRLGAKLMFGGLALLPPFFGLCFPVDNPSPLLVPVSIFFAGLCLQLYSRMFGEEPFSMAGSAGAYQMVNKPNAAGLPPADRTPVGGFDIRTVNTAETVPPPSVTDHTTKFFDQ